MKAFYFSAGIILIGVSYYFGILSNYFEFPNDCVAFSFVSFILGMLCLCLANLKKDE